MSFNQKDYKKFRSNIDSLLNKMPIEEETKQILENKVLGEAFSELDEIIGESRPPRILVFGRSGAGKSSLINALANKKVTEVGNIKPTTVESEVYDIDFPEQNAKWQVIDSRGLFESVSPDGDVPEDTISLVKKDIDKYKPDILLHVMTPDQVRAGEDDFEVVNQLRNEISSFPPMIYCLNKIDSHISPTDEWPPEQNESLRKDIVENMNFVSDLLGETNKEPFDNKSALNGYKFDSNKHIGVVPLYLKNEPYWNIETLSLFMGRLLPNSAQLQFAQAQRREQLMRDISRDTTHRFSVIAANIGVINTPGADIAILTPLQLLLVGIIGAYSGRELNKDTVKEFLKAGGLSMGAGFVGREAFRAVSQMFPGIGSGISASIAAGTTWSIGRAAEEYFFDGKVIDSKEFKDEGINKFEDVDKKLE